jgi:uncharacterized protein YkwD
VRRTIGAFVAALLAVGAAFGLVPAHASSWTSSSYASRLVQLVNQARQQHGLGALTVASGTSQVAASWTAHLDAAQSLSHNPDLRHQLETHGSADWTTYGENVGQGPSSDPDTLFKAYMNSSEHRSNILNAAYRFTGVAVVIDGNTAWNTFDFVDSYHSTTPTTSSQVKPKPKPSPKPTTAPRPVTSTHASASSAAVTASVTPPHPRTTHATSGAVEVKGTSRSLPHTRARRAAHALPNLARLPGDRAGRGARSQPVVLAASVHPLAPSLPASSELTVALAGLLLGFVGVRWWHVARAA